MVNRVFATDFDSRPGIGAWVDGLSRSEPDLKFEALAVVQSDFCGEKAIFNGGVVCGSGGLMQSEALWEFEGHLQGGSEHPYISVSFDGVDKAFRYFLG